MKTSAARIHWVSPLPPQQTDIAHYTRRILPELCSRADVVLWTDADHWDKELESFAPVRRFQPEAAVPMDMRSLPRNEGGEAIFFHVGNSWVFHSGIVTMARRMPGTIVLHDLAIQELLRDMVFNELLGAADYHAEMIRWHGAAGAEDARRVFAHGPVATDILENRPLFEATMRHAVSVLCHTGPAFDAVAARKFVPAYHLELPFGIGPDVSSARAHDGALKLVQFGHIGRNRRLEQVLEILSPLAAEIDFVFDIYGKVWDDAFVLRKIEGLGLAGRVRIHGFVDEPVLDAALREAHLVFNLRYPTMGEASGSQLRIWNAAALAAVTDLGWYASLPADTVARIPLDNEAAALAELLRKIKADRRFGETIGAAGRKRLVDHHGPDLYAEGIVAIAGRYAEDARLALLSQSARMLLERGPAPASIGQALCRQRLSETLAL
ncbi:MAG: hypothetical protein JNL61_06085 [Rhizobiaceae bacterium]|nr:hypothetical protein [Rhizobiaceae bacterium]